MFQHQGHTRTLSHNLRVASLLSFVAGMVNVTGFIAVQRLTTNVTGHFAYFAEEIFDLNFWRALIYFLYIFFFFAGSFSSNFLIEFCQKKNYFNAFAIPVLIECFILLIVPLSGDFLLANYPDLIAFLLLFSMGLQNSLVTRISNSTVRTTHLTGLFTDLGIELSQLIFYREEDQKNKLLSSIKLRFTIISFFFLGCIVSSVFYSRLGLYVFSMASGILLAGLFLDRMTLNQKVHRDNRN